MNFKIIFKQVYKGFLKNWKLFTMLIIFCISILTLIFGALSFSVQFKNEVYNPAITENAFSVGYLKNDFSYFDDEESNFRTNQKFESYFLKRINSVAGDANQYHFEIEDLKKIYDQDGYVNWVETDEFNSENENRVAAYEALINWSADFMGNVRFKIINEYVHEQTNWSFSFRNNQGDIAELPSSGSQIHLYSINLKQSNLGVVNVRTLLNNDSQYLSIYVSEKQLQRSNKLGDIVTLNLAYEGNSKNLSAKVVGTFTDYLTFSNFKAEDNYFLLNNSDYFQFVQQNFQNPDGSVDYSMIDYRNHSTLSKPLLSLVTGEKSRPLDFNNQFSSANNLLNNLCFDNFNEDSLNDELSSKIYLSLYQRNLMITLVMIGISILLIILFFVMFYFLIAQSIKQDLQTSLFLSSLGMNSWEISVIQVSRLLLPIIFSTCCSVLLAFLTKQLFWSVFSSTFSVSLKLFYFNWLTGLIFGVVVIGIFCLLLLINFVINQRLKNNKTSIEKVTFVDRAWIKGSKVIRHHRTGVAPAISFGSKNTFQNFFVFLVSLIIFTISGFSINFIQNINNISNIPLHHYKPLQSVSASMGPVIAPSSAIADDKYVTTYSFNEEIELDPIGDSLDLKQDSLEKILMELEHLQEDDLTRYYLSHNLIKQLDQKLLAEINDWDLDEQIKILLNQAYEMTNELKRTFAWDEGFNLNFGQWTKQNLAIEDRHFLSLDGMIRNAKSDVYLGNISQAYAVNPNDEFFNQEFKNLASDSKVETEFKKDNQSDNLPTINAYFPMNFQDFDFLRLRIFLNHKVKTEFYIKNVGINKFDNWDQIFILNKQQLFESWEIIPDDYSSGLMSNNCLTSILDPQNINQIDNGVYSTNKVPFFYRNVLLRSDGKGKKIENFLNSTQQLDIYGLNFFQVKKIIIDKLSEFNQLIIVILALLLVLMLIIALILIYLVIKENENYFKSFKALGYSTKEISFFLLPWILGHILVAGLIASLIVTLTTGLVGHKLTLALTMYLNYNLAPWAIVALIILPLTFMSLVTGTIYQFLNKVSVQNSN